MATTSDCDSGDAPAGYSSYDCSSVCSQTGSEWRCEVATYCPSQLNEAWIVSDTTSGHDAVAFGKCGADSDRFCCTFDEDSGNVDVVSLYGSEQGDEPLAFVWDHGLASEENLKPWDDDEIEGYIYGDDGGDVIRGSNYSGTDFQEYLYGQNGNDSMYGFADHDYLNGGNGEDYIEGMGGKDRIQGGCEDDEMDGGPNDDTICDHSGILNVCPDDCNTADTTLVTGGGGDDTLWYAAGANCGSSTMDAANSEMGMGWETCGNSNDWDPSELPNDCDVLTSAKPSKCTNP